MHRDRRGGSLEEVLDRAEGSTDPAGTALGGGRSKAAAYQKLRNLLRSSPAEISKLIETQMNEDFAAARSGPGLEGLQCSARAWIEHRSLLQRFHGPIRQAWTLGGIIDALNGNDPERAKAVALLALASSLDQAAVGERNQSGRSSALRGFRSASCSRSVRGQAIAPPRQPTGQHFDVPHSGPRSVPHRQEELGQQCWRPRFPSRRSSRRRRKRRRRRELEPGQASQRQGQGQREGRQQEARRQVSFRCADVESDGAYPASAASSPFERSGLAPVSSSCPAASSRSQPEAKSGYIPFSPSGYSSFSRDPNPAISHGPRVHHDRALPCSGELAVSSGLGPLCGSPNAPNSSVHPPFRVEADDVANSPTAGAPGSTLHHAAAGEPAEVPASFSGLGPLSGFPNRSPNPSAAPRARCANPAPAPAAKVGVLRGPSKPLPGSRATTVQPADLCGMHGSGR